MAVVLDGSGIDLRLVLGPLAMLRSDPTISIGESTAARATWTPEGPGVVRLRWGGEPGRVTLDAEGDGAAWLVARADALVGAHDDITTFQPEGIVGRLWSRFRGDRVAATGTVWHDLAWTITQQRIHRSDAASQWRRLADGYGEPCGEDGLRTPPDPERLARAAPWSLRAIGIDERRATALIAAARVASRLHVWADRRWDEAKGALSSLPGVGPWTLACLQALTWGDPDTVITGDSGIPSLITSTLVGERRGDDVRMLDLLEPYRPHRYRVLRLAVAARSRPRGM